MNLTTEQKEKIREKIIRAIEKGNSIMSESRFKSMDGLNRWNYANSEYKTIMTMLDIMEIKCEVKYDENFHVEVSFR